MEKYSLFFVVIKAELQVKREILTDLVVSICKVSLRFHFANTAFTKFTRFVICKELVRFGMLPMSLAYFGGLLFTDL